ncbi:hypothetical protein E2562_024442 [Oryza meyeriana var. granulata]|uniref:Uncharacterized protein n=1 Tax=Oryza meyeriana var. granulata TaxID=110450 RepID=A0A6G1EYN5_9ORYZ|nr:hypothetical protein E2562_024442 [Oryza meyeriana var. granulata]
MTKVQPQSVELEPVRKLQRLPQVYSRVLELPFPRNTNVRKHFTADADHFFVPHDVAGEPDVVKVHVVTLKRWDITRVVVHIGPGEPDLKNDLVYDKWRFPLAETSILSMIMAGYVNGQLVVVVPRMDVRGDGGKEGIPMWPNINKRGGGGGDGCKFGLCGGASHVPAK